MSATSEHAIWDPVEALPRDRLQALQLERLRATVARVLAGQPLGASRLAAAGVTDAGDVSSLEDLARLPFSHKADLRDHYPFGLFAVPPEQVVCVHASSGSHGKPTVVGYTRADLDDWSELMARCMTMAGVRPGMVVHNANGYGLFTGGLGFHHGADRIGATVVPVSGGFSARQAMLLSDLGAQVLTATPSYAVVIAQAVRDAGLDPASLQLELGLFGGEPWTDAMRVQIERELGLTAVGCYGLSEMCGPGVASE
jgi:phenylacetate-CoA ligase